MYPNCSQAMYKCGYKSGNFLTTLSNRKNDEKKNQQITKKLIASWLKNREHTVDTFASHILIFCQKIEKKNK